MYECALRLSGAYVLFQVGDYVSREGHASECEVERWHKFTFLVLRVLWLLRVFQAQYVWFREFQADTQQRI